MKPLKKCCCGCTLKTGALVICYITLIQSVVPILNILSDTAPDIALDKHVANEYKRDLMWICVGTVVIVAHALYGVYKKKAGYMVPFLIYKLFMLFILTLMLGFAPAIVDEFKPILASNVEKNVLPEFIISVLIWISIEGFFLFVLYSLYHYLRQEMSNSSNAANSGFPAIPVVTTTAAAPAANEMENGEVLPYPGDLYNNEVSKKQPPPPYAV